MSTSEDAVKLILGITTEECRKSCLQLAVKEIESIIGSKMRNSNASSFQLRNVDWTNNPFDQINRNDENLHQDIFTAMSLCMIILDQLGHIFTVSKSSVRIQKLLRMKELKGFITKYSLTGNDISALSNLRNSLNHNFGLASVGKKKHYKFLIRLNGMNEFMVHPKTEWDGNWNDKSEDSSTKINAFMIIAFVGEVLNKICELVENKKLTSPLPVEELKTRFTIVTN